MSTYLTTEAAALAACRAYNDGATFDTTNSSRDDWSVIDVAGDYSLVVEMGGETVEADKVGDYGAYGLYQEQHHLRITVLRRVGTAAEGIAAIVESLKTTVEGLKDHLRAHDRLSVGDPVRVARPTKTSQVQERVPRGGGPPTHVLQHITLMVWCESEYPESEGGY